MSYSNKFNNINFQTNSNRKNPATSLNCGLDGIRFISGYAHSSDSIPLSNAIVSFSQLICVNNTTHIELLGYTKTNSKGYFSFYININNLLGYGFKLAIYDTLNKRTITKDYPI